jgi:hypothetical protein
VTDAEIIQGIQTPDKFEAHVASEAEALRLAQLALPHALHLSPAQSGQPYPQPPHGVLAWFQVHPAEPAVGNHLPHVKYEDWTGGKKGRGGCWGHLFFPPATAVT